MNGRRSSHRIALDRVHREWILHTLRHQRGRGWGAFRSLVSVLQVAFTFVLVTGFTAQTPLIAEVLPNGLPRVSSLLPSVPELGLLALFVVPEWLEVFFFGRADEVLRSYRILKPLSPDDLPPSPPLLSRSALGLEALRFCQLSSRLINVAVHVSFGVILSVALFSLIGR